MRALSCMWVRVSIWGWLTYDQLGHLWSCQKTDFRNCFSGLGDQMVKILFSCGYEDLVKNWFFKKFSFIGFAFPLIWGPELGSLMTSFKSDCFILEFLYLTFCTEMLLQSCCFVNQGRWQLFPLTLSVWCERGSVKVILTVHTCAEPESWWKWLTERLCQPVSLGIGLVTQPISWLKISPFEDSLMALIWCHCFLNRKCSVIMVLLFLKTLFKSLSCWLTDEYFSLRTGLFWVSCQPFSWSLLRETLLLRTLLLVSALFLRCLLSTVLGMLASCAMQITFLPLIFTPPSWSYLL